MSKANELLRRVIESGVLHMPSEPLLEFEAEICEYLGSVKGVQFIVAGSASQAAHLAQSKGVKDYRLVQTVSGIREIERGETVWMCGTYYNLKSWGAMLTEMQYRELKTLAVRE